MRLDKYLKITRLIKRRTVANEACDGGRILVNGKVARASYAVKEGDLHRDPDGQQAPEGQGALGQRVRHQGERLPRCTGWRSDFPPKLPPKPMKPKLERKDNLSNSTNIFQHG